MDDAEFIAAQKWMKEALAEAVQAIKEGEVPVGAVFVAHNETGGVRDLDSGSIVARGHNLTNRTRNVCELPFCFQYSPQTTKSLPSNPEIPNLFDFRLFSMQSS